MEAEQKNGPAQSPPSRPGLAVNPFLGRLAPVLLAVVVKAKEKEGRKEGRGLWRNLALQFGGTWPSSYNFRADLEQLARGPLPRYFQEMVRGSGDSPDRVLYLQKPTLPAHHTIPGSLQPDQAVSHQLKSFRPCSWPLDSWAALLGTGVSWAGGQSPRGGALV